MIFSRIWPICGLSSTLLQNILNYLIQTKNVNKCMVTTYSLLCWSYKCINTDSFSFPSSVADTLKDYAIKALVNTVDHLGSASYKVDHLLNENIDEIAEADLQVSCIEQVRFYFIGSIKFSILNIWYCHLCFGYLRALPPSTRVSILLASLNSL